MPTSWVIDEDKWARAKELAEQAGQGDNYPYITGIYKQMKGRIKGTDLAKGKGWHMAANPPPPVRPTMAKTRLQKLAARRPDLVESGFITKADLLPGGRADKMTDADFDPEALAEGERHELEHTKDRKLAREIARDHLAEDPDYYRKLRELEKSKMPRIFLLLKAKPSPKKTEDGKKKGNPKKAPTKPKAAKK